METYAGFAEHADHHVGRLVDTLEELGVLDDTLVLYLLGDNGASGEGGPEGTIREHLVGHGSPTTSPTWTRGSTRSARPTTYAMYPSGWALAMNTPYQWTKQVASHFGGTRDGLVVHWPTGIEARGEVRHQFHHVIDVLPTMLEAAGLPLPETVNGVPQQRVEGVSMRYCFDDPDAEDRRTHAVLRDGRQPRDLPRGLDRGHPARHPVADGRGAAPVRRRRVGALRHPLRLVARPTTSRPSDPERLRQAAGRSSTRRPRSTRCFPLDDRVTERENPQLAGRHDLQHGRTSVVLGRRHRSAHRGGRAERQEPVAPDHGRPRDPGRAPRRSRRRACWSRRAAASAAGRCTSSTAGSTTPTTATARTSPRSGRDSVLWPGKHEVALDFRYDGGPPGSGGEAAILRRRERGGAGPDRGDHGVLLRLRRDVQRRHRPGHLRSPTTTPRCATASPERSTGCVVDLGPQEPLPREGAHTHALKQAD